MANQFAVLTEGRNPKIYKLPVSQTARLINEIPGRKVEVFETLDSARKAALAIVTSTKAKTKPDIGLFASRPDPEDEELLKTLAELTEDRIEKYNF